VVHRGASIVFFGAIAMGTGVGALAAPVVVGLVGVALLGIAVYEYAYYTRFRYAMTADTLDIRSGVISRREREIPYGRIQNVDVSQSIGQRLLDIAAVDIETAGGSQTEGSLRFVSAAEARRLQRVVQERKRDTDTEGGEPAADPAATPSEATEQAGDELFAIEPSELLLKGALSFDPRIIGAVLFLGPGSASVLLQSVSRDGRFALSAVAIAAVGGMVVAAWLLGIVLAVLNYYGFRLTRHDDDLRYERGVLRRYSGSIPLSKLQTLIVTENPLMRAAGYASLSIETAGYAPGQGDGRGSQAAIPIARRERVLAVVDDLAAPGTPTFVRPPSRVRWRYAVRYLLAGLIVLAVLFVLERTVVPGLGWEWAAVVLVFVPPAAHLKWSHRGYWLGQDCVVTRNGFWRRSTRIVPYYRIQMVIDSRTVVQRRWDLATVTVDTAGGASLLGRGAVAADIDGRDAERLRSTLNDRLQSALAERPQWSPADGPLEE
jgi:putative membrane protein